MKCTRICLLVSLLVCACADNDKDTPEQQSQALDCGAGHLFEYGGDEVCVYDEDLADLEFECPEDVPAIDYFAGFVVCSEDGADQDIESAVYDAYPELEPEPPPPCTEDTLAPNQTEATARPLQFGERYDLVVCPEENFEERWDYWTVDLDAGQWVTIVITSDNYAMDVRKTGRENRADFRDDVFTGIAGGSYVGPWQRTVGAITYQAAAATRFEFHVARLFGSQYESHEYSLELLPGCVTDAGCGDGLVCDRRLLACLPTVGATCGDDGAEPNDAEATPTPIPTDATPVTDLALCSADLDRFSFQADPGDSLEISVAHDQGEDGSIAVYLLREDGSVEASEARPSHEGLDFRMPYVRGGAYQLLVGAANFDDDAVNYQLGLTVTPGACETDLDCSHAPTTERAQCIDAACQGIAARADVPLGGQCDDAWDCVEETWCGLYGATADKWVCTVECQSDAECGGVGAGAYCLPASCDYELGQCLPACDADADCGDGFTCTDGRCGECGSNADCGGARTCTMGVCVDSCDYENSGGQND